LRRAFVLRAEIQPMVGSFRPLRAGGEWKRGSRRADKPRYEPRCVASANPLWSAHARHAGQVAMGFAADIVFEAHVVAQGVDEASLPITRVVV
jgi:hypothetical protein